MGQNIRLEQIEQFGRDPKATENKKILIYNAETDLFDYVDLPEGLSKEDFDNYRYWTVGKVSVPAVGALYGGGKVFFVAEDKSYALIAALYNEDACVFTRQKLFVPGTVSDDSLAPQGLGKVNTDKLTGAFGYTQDYAAGKCRLSERNGFTDWYLPSLGELNCMARNTPEILTPSADRTGGYWSSSMIMLDDLKAAYIVFLNNGQGNSIATDISTDLEVNVRAVRKVLFSGFKIESMTELDIEGKDGISVVYDKDNKKIVIGANGFKSTYSCTEPNTEQVHGLEKGEVYYEVPYSDLFYQLTHPYQLPGINSFYFDQASFVECGILLSGAKKAFWAFTNIENVKTLGGELYDVTEGAVLIKSGFDPTACSVQFDLVLANNAPFKRRYVVKARSTKDVVITSNEYTIESVYPFFVGETDKSSVTADDIYLLSRRVVGKSAQHYSYTLSGKRYVCAFPRIYGEKLLNISDDNGFNIAPDFVFTQITLNINTLPVEYVVAVYKTNITGVSNYNLTFNL